MQIETAIEQANELTNTLRQIRASQWELHTQETEIANQLFALRKLITTPKVIEPGPDETTNEA